MLQILIFNINNALKLLTAATSEVQGKVTFLNLSLDKSLCSKLMAFMLEMKQLRLREVKWLTQSQASELGYDLWSKAVLELLYYVLASCLGSFSYVLSGMV